MALEERSRRTFHDDAIGFSIYFLYRNAIKIEALLPFLHRSRPVMGTNI